MYALKLTATPARSSSAFSPFGIVDVSLGEVIATTSASADARPLVSSYSFISCNSATSILDKTLANIKMTRIIGVIFLISIPPTVRYPYPR